MPNRLAVAGGGDRDVGQLPGVRLGHDGAVGVDQHPVGQAHQERAGHQRDPGRGADELERRPDGVRGGVRGPGDHPVGQPLVDHHGAEVRRVGHHVVGLHRGDALVLAQLGVGLREPLAVFGRGGVDHRHPGQPEPERGGPGGHLVRAAEHGQVGDAAQQQLLGRGQHPVVVALGEHDVPAVGAGPLQQCLLEHQRRGPGRAGHLQPFAQQVVVDVVLELADRGGDLPLAGRADRAAHAAHRGHRLVGVGADREHRHPGVPEPGNQPAHRGVDDAAGEHQPGHRAGRSRTGARPGCRRRCPRGRPG